jgi:hypothetical protein
MSTVQQLYDKLALKQILVLPADIYAAVNFAIDAGVKQGFVLSERIDNAGTLTTATFNYTMSTALDRWLGVGEFLLNEETNHLEIRHRGLCQHYDQSAGAWILEIPEAIVSGHIGKTFDILYYTPFPQVDAMTDQVYLPDFYAVARMEEWACKRKMTDTNSDTGPWANLFINAQRQADSWRGNPPPRLPEVRRKDRPA